jgi:hypothetical protein
MYFDSAGDDIKEEFEIFVNRVLKQAEELDIILEYDKKHVQHQRGNTECGMYSLYFIITLLTGETDRGVHLKGYKEKYNFFKNKKLRIPDKFVFDLRKKYFNSGGSQ